MRKCLLCHKKLEKPGIQRTFFCFYDSRTQYIYYFCSWWHLTKWYIRRWLPFFRKEQPNV